MSKFFNLNGNKETDINKNNSNESYISSNKPEESETFVYNTQNNPGQISNLESMQLAENYINNQIDYSNTDVLEENEVLEVPNVNNNSDMSSKINPELDPLNNANNPIPVNPISPKKEELPEEELPKNVKANIFSVIKMMIGMAFTPGTTIVNNSKKYRSFSKAIAITLWITIVTLILCIGVRVLIGSFNKTYSAVTASYKINFDFTNIFNLDNYLQFLLIAFIISFVTIMISSLIYYASSFINSKGVVFGSYLMVSNLALLPLIIGVVVFYPIANLLSTYIGLLVLIFSFLYTLISFIIGISEILTFKNINRKILYNVLNISVIVLIMIFIFAIFVNSNILILPELNL